LRTCLCLYRRGIRRRIGCHRLSRFWYSRDCIIRGICRFRARICIRRWFVGRGRRHRVEGIGLRGIWMRDFGRGLCGCLDVRWMGVLRGRLGGWLVVDDEFMKVSFKSMHGTATAVNRPRFLGQWNLRRSSDELVRIRDGKKWSLTSHSPLSG